MISAEKLLPLSIKLRNAFVAASSSLPPARTLTKKHRYARAVKRYFKN